MSQRVSRRESPSRAFLVRRLKAIGAEPPEVPMPPAAAVAALPGSPPPAPPMTAAERRAAVTGLPPQTGTFTVLRFA